MSADPSQDSDVKIDVTALKLYPEFEPADSNLQSEIESLWINERGFIVLAGPPGVGKTRAAEDLIVKILNQNNSVVSKEDSRLTNIFPNYQANNYSSEDISSRLTQSSIEFVWEMCVLHPQYAYEDLIRGVHISTSGESPSLHVKEGVLGFISRVVGVLENQTANESGLPLGVLILDEVNRAALGQLFGESIFALDRRGTPVATSHDLEGHGCLFTIPKHLLILGTMNSVDRAISGFDFALKRRFVTVTVGTSVAAIDATYQRDERLRQVAIALFDLFKQLIDSAEQTGVVAKSELLVGHSYFLAPDPGDTDASMRWLSQSVQYQIIPLLIDYQEQGLIRYDRAVLASNPFGEAISSEIPLWNLKSDEILANISSLAASVESE